jgi:hypothetical protein
MKDTVFFNFFPMGRRYGRSGVLRWGGNCFEQFAHHTGAATVYRTDVCSWEIHFFLGVGF